MTKEEVPEVKGVEGVTVTINESPTLEVLNDIKDLLIGLNEKLEKE